MPPRRKTISLPPVGRYDLRDAVMPPGEQLGEPTAVRRKHTRIAAVPDPKPPDGDPHRRHFATVNIRTDLLELEYAHNRISEAALRIGRQIQGALERTSQVGAGNQWRQGDRVDAYQRHEEVIVNHLECAREVEALFTWIRKSLGKHNVDCKIIRNILGDNMSYGATAVLHGKRGDRGVRYIAERFRDSLEALANAQSTSRGKVPLR